MNFGMQHHRCAVVLLGVVGVDFRSVRKFAYILGGVS
jgi:hypothetical protein